MIKQTMALTLWILCVSVKLVCLAEPAREQLPTRPVKRDEALVSIKIDGHLDEEVWAEIP